MIETEARKECYLLVGVEVTSQSDGFSMDTSLDELEELLETAGGRAVGRVIQRLEHAHPGTYLGKGKLEETKELLGQTCADGIVCDDELSPAQLKNMEQFLDCKILDRTMVILDIFADRARSSEGKIQVELAQLRDRAIRLVGMRASLSRLGGGIGTRGPGEKKLEMDRRLIHQRIGQLKDELEQVKRHRVVTRQQRSRNQAPVAAIVGYTNAGKSTLLNAMTGAEILAEDKLFATLDPTTRVCRLPGDDEILLTDTVGFIQKLPHHLIDAFLSTLEEAKYADIILHVVDASNPSMELQMYVVYETLRKLGIENKTILTLYNKQDRLREQKKDAAEETADSSLILRDFHANAALGISAVTGEGLEELKKVLARILQESRTAVDYVFSYEQAGRIQILRKYGQVQSEEYTDDGIHVTGTLSAQYKGMLPEVF